MHYSIPINLDKQRHLKLGFLAVTQVDQQIGPKYGVNFFQAITKLTDGWLNMDVVAEIYFYGLRHEDDKLTKQKTIQLLETALAERQHGVSDLIRYLIEAAQKSGILDYTEDEEAATSESDADPLEPENG